MFTRFTAALAPLRSQNSRCVRCSDDDDDGDGCFCIFWLADMLKVAECVLCAQFRNARSACVDVIEFEEGKKVDSRKWLVCFLKYVEHVQRES